LSVMRLATLIVGEVILLVASILVFRSAWTLLDEYLGKSNLWLLLIIGVVLTVIGLIIVNYEVKCELQKKRNGSASE
jgi:riboflavin transporter FmnP